MGLRLGNVVEVNRTRSPFVLQRTNGQRVVEIALEVAPDAISEVDKRIADYLSTLEMPAGVSVDRGMMEKFKLEVYDDLILTAALAIILIYMVMASQFEGFLSPLIIMVTLPLALIGSAIFLFVYDRTLNISGIIGMIILSGIVVNNGIVLVDYINQLRRRGMGLEEATVKGAGDRLRAILMTALTTILGLLPQALSLNSYTNIQIPMALAVMGGLLTSTLLTLTVVPCIYYLLEKARKKVRERG
jgi:HAE1 family hydrophobic/amphiphilic exporter-1